MKSEQDPRVIAWFNDRPEVLSRYPNHWAVINIRHHGVSIADENQLSLLEKMDQERHRILDRGQKIDEIFMVHTSSFRGRIE